MSLARRERSRENIRREILDAAREIFVTEDYKAVSLRRIAEKVDYSPSAIYFYFKDKEEILLQLIQEGYELLAQAVFHANSANDPVEFLRQGGRAYLAFARQYPHYYKIMFQIACEAPSPDGEQVGKEVFDLLVQKIEEAVGFNGRQLEIDVRATAAAIWACLHGLATLKITGMKLIEPYEATEARLIAGMFEGLLP